MKLSFALAALAIILSSQLSLPRGADGEVTRDELPPDPARILTRQGELVVGTLELETISVRTKYGVLDVPIADVVALDLAFAKSADAAKRFQETVASYRNALDDGVRSQLRRELLELGQGSREMIEAARNGADGAVRELLDDLLATLEERGERETRRKDVVFTRKFNILGEIELSGVDVDTAYGPLHLARSDIGRIVLRGGSMQILSDKVIIVKTWTDPSGEYQNTKNILDQRTKARLVEFTGTTAADLTKAIRKSGVVVLPELEQGGNCAQVAEEAAKAIKRWVRDGGVIVSCGGNNNISFLNATGLFSCSQAGGSSDATVRRKHPILKGVNGTIPAANATVPIHVDGTKMKVLAGTDAAVLVGLVNIGDGAVVYCGWDYYASEDSHQRVLANAVDWARGRGGGGLTGLE